MSRIDRLSYVPEPSIILLGCQPWPPGEDPDHPAQCPVCKGVIGLARRFEPAGEPARYVLDQRDHKTSCEWCGAMSPENQRKAAQQRYGHEAGPVAERAERDAGRELSAKFRGIVLTESERRRIWAGCKGDGLSSPEQVTNRAKAGRDWLRAIGQEPDWNLVIDKRGNVIGRLEPSDELGPILETELAPL